MTVDSSYRLGAPISKFWELSDYNELPLYKTEGNEYDTNQSLPSRGLETTGFLEKLVVTTKNNWQNLTKKYWNIIIYNGQ